VAFLALAGSMNGMHSQVSVQSSCDVNYTVTFLALAGGMNGMDYSGQCLVSL
jgi:hypothetical protein